MGLKEAVAALLLSCLEPTLRMMVQAGRQRTTLVNCKQLSKHSLNKHEEHIIFKAFVSEKL